MQVAVLDANHSNLHCISSLSFPMCWHILTPLSELLGKLSTPTYPTCWLTGGSRIDLSACRYCTGSKIDFTHRCLTVQNAHSKDVSVLYSLSHKKSRAEW